ncbi:MAG: PAS domain S-box protein [Desulfovibrio sp.]|nr:PAS domain S-box protein [Desulfovibrio sp.]
MVRLCLGVVLVNLFVVSMTVLSLRRSRMAYEDRMAGITQNLCQVLEQHVASILDKVDIALLVGNDEITRQLASGGINGPELKALLARLHSRLPELNSLRTTDAYANITQGVGVDATRPENIADREYFKLLREHPDSGLVISSPLVGRISGKPMLVVARRANSPDGSFAGITYGTILLEYFSMLFAAVEVGAHGSIALRNQELALLVRHEAWPSGSVMGQRTVSAEFRALVDQGHTHATFRATYPVDNIERTYTYRKVSHYPLFVIVGLATKDHMAAWYKEAFALSAITGGFFLVTVGIAWLILRERKTVDRALAYNRSLIEASLDPLVTIGQDGKITDVNSATENATGIARENLVGTDFSDYFSDPDKAKQAFSTTFLKGSVRDFPLELRHGDETLSVLYNATVYTNEKGEVAGVLAVARDVTERKRMQESVAQSENRFRLFMEYLPGAVFIKDHEGTVFFANTYLKDLFNWTNPVGLTTVDLLPAEIAQKMVENDRQALEMGYLFIEEKFVDRQGQPRVFATHKFAIPVTGGKSLLGGIALDITDQRKMEEVMIQAEKMMSVGGLAAGMAHEINNPLGGILQGAQVLQRRLGEDSPPNRSAAELAGCDLKAIHRFMKERQILPLLESMRESAARAAKIVQDMLSFSRQSSSESSSEDPAGLMDRAVALCSNDYDLKKKYDFRHIRIIREYQPGVSPIQCSCSKIEQVLVNILRNAAQALRADEGRGGEPVITLRTRQEGDQVVMEIEDNGPGMDEKTRKSVFEPFFTTKSPGVGTGLGLSVSYFIVTTIHGGSIEVDSSPGKGTRFIITLPVRHPGEGQMNQAS